MPLVTEAVRVVALPNDVGLLLTAVNPAMSTSVMVTMVVAVRLLVVLLAVTTAVYVPTEG
jgi:hypothetical protein